MVSTDEDPAATTTSMLTSTPTPSPTSTTRRRNADEHEHAHHDEPANGQCITHHHDSISKALDEETGTSAILQKENVYLPFSYLTISTFLTLSGPKRALRRVWPLRCRHHLPLRHLLSLPVLELVISTEALLRWGYPLCAICKSFSDIYLPASAWLLLRVVIFCLHLPRGQKHT